MRIDRKKLSVIMESNNFTSSKLSEQSGIHIGTISRIRCGASCRYETALALARTLNVPIEELLEAE